MRLMQLTEKTKFGMSIAQWVTVFLFLIAFGGTIAGYGESLNETKKATDENRKRIDAHEDRLNRQDLERAAQNKEMLIMIYEIRESQIRMEGKLDLKVDKFSK